MNGQELYEMWREGHLRRDCETDRWEELTDNDRDVWNEMAEMLVIVRKHL